MSSLLSKEPSEVGVGNCSQQARKHHNLAWPTGVSFISATSTALKNLETALYPHMVRAAHM
jgi:hypothetical protein